MSELTDYPVASAVINALFERSRSQARTIDFLSAQIAALQAAHRVELKVLNARLSEQCAVIDGMEQLLIEERDKVEQLTAKLEGIGHVGQ